MFDGLPEHRMVPLSSQLFRNVDELRWCGPTDAFAACVERLGEGLGRTRSIKSKKDLTLPPGCKSDGPCPTSTTWPQGASTHAAPSRP